MHHFQNEIASPQLQNWYESAECGHGGGEGEEAGGEGEKEAGEEGEEAGGEGEEAGGEGEEDVDAHRGSKAGEAAEALWQQVEENRRRNARAEEEGHSKSLVQRGQERGQAAARRQSECVSEGGERGEEKGEGVGDGEEGTT